MFGSHLSIAGGLHNALISAQTLKMDCVQVFTKNQRQWSATPLKEEEISLWNAHKKSTGIDVVVSHDSYLINLASPEERGENWEKSIELFRDELQRCEALGIPWLVTHPGAHLSAGGAGDAAGEKAGLTRVAQALNRLHQELPGLKTVTCLEVTAGQGTSLGYRFAHIRDIIAQVKDPSRLAVCLDTAHMIEAGYDLSSAAGCQATLDELDDVVGLELVRVVHANDSKTPRGSKVDRHTHIGQGHVSLQAFQVMVNEPHFRKVPKILETPKEDAPDGTPWDTINMTKLKKMIKRGKRAK